MYKLEDILNDKDLNKFINAIFYKAYQRYSLVKHIEYDDYKQEQYIYLMKVLPKYDNNLASIKSYLYSCIYNRAFNLFRFNTTIGRYDDKETVSLNNTQQELNKRVDWIENIEDITEYENIAIANDLYNYIIDKHKDDKLYKTILDYLLQGYSKFRISKLIGKTRPVVERRVEKIKSDVMEYYEGNGEICMGIELNMK